jgi:hypothetical protein
MQDDIRARGSVSVILVMDMKSFVDPRYRQRFESIRGYRAYAEMLKQKWPGQLAGGAFEPVDADIMGVGRSPTMSTDEVGFVTGIFRLNILDLYSSPVYKVNKERFEFSPQVKTNLQFVKLFAPIWKDWDFYIRPTMTGMLVLRLERRYDKPLALLKQATNVIELQTPFDVPGAIKALNKLENQINDPVTTAEQRQELKPKADATRAFLSWLDVQNLESPELDYIPVQWQLAREIGYQLIRDVGAKIHLPDGTMIPFSNDKPDLSSSLYDSYTVYHVDELLVEPSMIAKTTVAQDEDTDDPSASDTQEISAKPAKNLVSVDPSDVKRSLRIKWFLVGMIEGAILSHTPSSGSTKRRFPRHNLHVVDRVFDQDMATWSDELCLLTARTAIVMPSQRSSREQLFISKLDAKTTTTFVAYPRYWEALERLVEFVAEISILSQLVENASADTLQQFVSELDHARQNILQGQLNGPLQDNQRRLTELTNQSANLSRLVGLCQGLINPNYWSRAEYAVDKANHLMTQMQVSILVNNAERNVSNLTNLVDHVDELVLAQLSESSNEQNSRQSLILAGLSLSIILFTLPSFWADINQLSSTNTLIQFIQRYNILTALAVMGSILAPIIFIGSIMVAVSAAMPSKYKFWKRHKPTSRPNDSDSLAKNRVQDEESLAQNQKNAQTVLGYKSPD